MGCKVQPARLCEALIRLTAQRVRKAPGWRGSCERDAKRRSRAARAVTPGSVVQQEFTRLS